MQFEGEINRRPYLLLLVIATILFIACTTRQKTVFKQVAASQSGIDFINEITEDDSLNILESEFVYNGAGVAIGDLNGDGLDDLFFTGNQVENRLYINRGKLQFEDVSKVAGIIKPHIECWSSGVNLVDINLDGKLDIYVCNTLRKKVGLRRNFLYINQGNDEHQIPFFKEMAAQYGMDDTSHSSHAQFFDFDNDGDLDLFVGVNQIEAKYPNAFIPLVEDGSAINRDNLFENEWSDSLGHPFFKNISVEAGILQDGYSHSSLIFDLNNDGWLDIYVANDYESNDLIFINNQDGTFTNRAVDIFKHFSLSAMGSDVADVNNDGKLDLVTSEMQPYYNKRKKLFQGESSYQREILTRRFNYLYQYTRNTLQLNLGTSPETGLPIFGEVGLYAGVQETDWSWATLFGDYDNDGFQDLFIANGFPKDVTDRDFADFRALSSSLVSRDALFAAIPEVKSPNFMFRNQGGLRFEDVTNAWGLNTASFSNGAAYGDLDGDGDLDLVVNNIDDPVMLFENQTNAINPRHFLRIHLLGPSGNPDAFGAAVTVYHDGWQQKACLISSRGYLSKSESYLHFGLDHRTSIDSMLVQWPGGMIQKIGQTMADQLVKISYDQQNIKNPKKQENQKEGLFAQVAGQFGLTYKHREIDFVDFNFQRTLPHKFSQFGPSLAVGDINNDGLDDLFIASSRSFPQTWFIQHNDGQFRPLEVNYKGRSSFEEDAGCLLFDADLDGDLDLYIARGGAQQAPADTLYRDILLINNGGGTFIPAPDALPQITSNGSCVKAADFDLDGDLDLFIGSRVLPHAYPQADRCYLLRNDSQSGVTKFTDVTEAFAPDLVYPGLISDALWTDYNGDFWPDLLVAGEWMPLTLFENQQGKLVDKTTSAGLDQYRGWWTSLAAADLDNDGDIDYIAGNYGENIYFQCSPAEPLTIYGQDLDHNGSIDPLISCYWRDSLGQKHEYLYHPRQDVIKQFVGIRKRFNTYAEFGTATVPEMFAEGEMDGALILKANWMKTSWIENIGNGHFKVHALPMEAQLAPVYAILPTDFNHDGLVDLVLAGNDFGMEVQQGRADASVGLAIKNTGTGFLPLTLDQSRFYLPGDVKSLVKMKTSNQSWLILAGQNNGLLRAFSQVIQTNQSLVNVPDRAIKCILTLQDGKTRMEEFYWGSGFQSQSGRFVIKDSNVKNLKFFSGTGEEMIEVL